MRKKTVWEGRSGILKRASCAGRDEGGQQASSEGTETRRAESERRNPSYAGKGIEERPGIAGLTQIGGREKESAGRTSVKIERFSKWSD